MRNHHFIRMAAIAMAAVLLAALTGCSVKITQAALPGTAALIKGETLQLEVEYGAEKEATAEKLAEAAAKLTLAWESSDESVVTVDETGLATAVGGGEADVTVSIQDTGIQSVCHITVTVPLERVEAPEALALVINGEDTAALGARLVPEDTTGAVLVYESSDESVAAVGQDGTVTAVGNGVCVITAAAAPEALPGEGEPDGDEIDPEMSVTPEAWIARTEVTVKTAPTGITLETTEGILTVGSAYTIRASVAPADVSEELAALTWASSDESIAAVDENGKVTAKAVGTVTITVTAANGRSAEYTLTVQQVKCSYCGQYGHTSANCPVKKADQQAAAAAAQQAAAQQAAAQQAAAAQESTGGGDAGGGDAGGGDSGSGGGYTHPVPDYDSPWVDDSAAENTDGIDF